MTLRLRLSLTILLLLTASTAWAVLSPEDYEHWQGYNGWRIRVITFPGIHSFSRSELLAVMATEKPTWLRRYVPIGKRTIFYADDWASDLFRVEHFYAREGFPHAIVHGEVFANEKKRELTLKMEISEGPPVILKGWSFELGEKSGIRPDSAHWASVMPVKIGKRLAESDVKVSADTLAYQLREMGYARARVEYFMDVDSATNAARILFGFYPGDYCYLDGAHITGLKQIGEEVVRRELAYHEFDPYSPVKLNKTRERIVRLEAFNFVNVRADTSVKSDTLPVIINTEEGNRYRMRVGGGYDQLELARGFVEFRDLNFFGRGRRVTWSGTVAQIHRLGEVNLFWPHTPWNPTDVTLNPRWEWQKNPGWNIERKSFTTILSSQVLFDKVTLAFSNEAGSQRVVVDTSVKVTNINVDSLLNRAYPRSVETISASWDTRNNPLIPTRGHVLNLSLAESGAVYGGRYRWWRAMASGRMFYPVKRFTTFAGRAMIGAMGPLHNHPTTPFEERFYLGGPSDVRGWSRNTLSPRSPTDLKVVVGGDFAYFAGAEIRQQVWGPVAIALFSDAGNVWKSYSSSQPFNLYPSGGIGLLFITLVGPVRVDYAYQLRKNPWGQRLYSVDFSLGSPF